MLLNPSASADRRNVSADIRERAATSDPIEALEISDITALSVAEINSMTCDELVRLIHVAGLPHRFRPDLDPHLPFYDHTMLKRMAHLAQQFCRNQGTTTLGRHAE